MSVMRATQQHHYEVWASTLLYLTFVLSLVTDYLLGHGYFAPHKSTSQYFLLYVANPFLLYVYYQIRRGVRGAKILFLTLYAFVLLQFLSKGVKPTWYDTELKAFDLAAQHTSQLIASLLLLLSLRTPTDEVVKAS